MVNVFQKGHFYMHKNSSDHCIEIMHAENHPYYVRLTVRTWNLGYRGQPFLVSQDLQEFNLSRLNFDMFTEIDLDFICAVRVVAGLPTIKTTIRMD